MNRRELIIGIIGIPFIPTISEPKKYVTPPHYEAYERYFNDFGFISWEEIPFEDIKVNDIVRRKREPDKIFKVTMVLPELDKTHPASFACLPI